MVKTEAIIAMLTEGKKTRRTAWPIGEYVVFDSSLKKFLNEKGEFFRIDQYFDFDWEIYEEPKKKKQDDPTVDAPRVNEEAVSVAPHLCNFYTGIAHQNLKHERNPSITATSVLKDNIGASMVLR